MMAVRLVELHRVLKDTGSLYLHCDPVASHYLKLVLDAVFGPENYRNEITWLRSRNPKGSQHQAKRYSPDTDSILFYGRSERAELHSDRIKRPLTSDELNENTTGWTSEVGTRTAQSHAPRRWAYVQTSALSMEAMIRVPGAGEWNGTNWSRLMNVGT